MITNRSLGAALRRGFVLLALALAACGGGGNSGPNFHLEVTPANPSAALGTDPLFTATAVYDDGHSKDVTASASWSSSDTSVATIDSAGKAHAAAVGSTTIGASFSGKSASTTLTVTPAVIAAITVTPATPSVPKGGTQQFTATATFTDNTTQNVTASANWTSSDTSVATVGNSGGNKGLAAALSAGTATIAATYQSVAGSTTLTVTDATLEAIQVTPSNPNLPATYKRQFTATGIYSDGSHRDITADVVWGSTDDSIASISNASGSEGVATGLKPGSVTISAQESSVTGTTTLTVTNATLTAVQVTPASASIPLGATQQFTATGVFTDNSTLDLTTQSNWTSSDSTVATVSNSAGSQGLATSVKQGGPVTITATVSSKSGSASLTVTAATLQSIAITTAGNVNSIPKGETLQFTATGVYSDSSTRDLTQSVTWQSSDASVATVGNASGSNGLATAVGEGTATISATQGGVTSNAFTLTVSSAVLTSLTISPADPSVPLGAQQAFTATGTYSDGSQRDLTKVVTWTSDDTSVATISNAAGSEGVATAEKQGSANITASDGSVTQTTTLTVTSAALSSIAVTPADSTIAAGTSLQYTATGTYTDGSTQDLTDQVTWSSSDRSVADVSNSAGTQGQALARAKGQVTITATESKSSVSGSTSLTVTDATLKSISVTATSGKNGNLPDGYSVQLTATGEYSDGSEQDITDSVSWSSLDPSIANVSSDSGTQGVTTGANPGQTVITAALGTASGIIQITVTDATLSSIAVTPADATLKSGSTLQYTATGTFSDGETLDLTTQVVWASSKPNVANISNTPGSQGLAKPGLFTGTTTISGTSGQVSGSTSLQHTLF